MHIGGWHIDMNGQNYRLKFEDVTKFCEVGT